MKFIRYTSVLSLMLVCGMDSVFGDAPQAPRPVYMTSQIQRLLNEKQEKVSKLEECDGKRKGFMIAGISTIGLTAVGVGINIAQASKSNKLSNQIEEQNRQLEKQQANLADINSQISEKQNENKRRECEGDPTKIYVNGQCLDRAPYECAQNPNKEWKDGQCVDKVKPENPSQPHDYSGYTLDCAHTKFEFIVGSDYQAVLQRLNNQCKTDTGVEMAEVLREKTPGGKVVFECQGYPTSGKCGNPAEGNTPILFTPCNDSGSVWTHGGDQQCLPSVDATQKVPCSCPPASQTQPGQENPTHDTPTPVVEKPDCYKSVEDYLALGCKKCIQLWTQSGQAVCAEIDSHGGFTKVSQKDAVLKENGQDYTPVVVSAKDGFSSTINCPGICADFNQKDAEDCRLSGGEWRYSNSKKAYECHCGTVGSYTDRHMALTNKNTCNCQVGYVLIDENFPIKGCRLGSNHAEQDAYIKSVNSLQAKWDSMNTKVGQCEIAAKNVATATEENSAKKFVDQAKQYASSALSLATEATGLYNKVKAEFKALLKEDQRAVERHRQAAENIKADVDKVQSKVNECTKKANDEYIRLVDRIEARNNPNTGALCVQSHGVWNSGKCSCDSGKNLEPSSDRMSCVCKKVGNNRYEWHDKCNMCRHPNAVDKDMACGV